MIRKISQAIRLLLLFLSATLNSVVFAADLHLSSLFQEHMVLQRDMPIKVWGTAKPLSLVTVQLASETVKVKADANGHWLTKLSARSAGGPYPFIVRSNEESITFNDVMLGEVWICSGQSNMFMGYDGIPEIKALEKKTENIRSFTVDNVVAFDEQDGVGGTWKIAPPPSAVAFAFAYNLQKDIDITVGIIKTAWGSSSLEGWMPRDMTEQLPHFKVIMDEFDADAAKHAKIDSILSLQGKRPRKADIFLRTQPNVIYNAMMHGLAPYSCRGMVWYQGEANSGTMKNMKQYGKSLPLWVERIRQDWGRDDMAFLAVMLPGYGCKIKDDAAVENPTVKSWAWMRESQCKVLDLPHTDIVTTIDLGLRNNIHPKDKLPIGRRLALLAEKNTLGMDVQAQGPIFAKAKVKKACVIVSFNESKGLMTKDGKAPSAFWISHDAEHWYKADASIIKEKVVLSSSEVSHPQYVRYAFAAKPKVNLVNGAGLPARPFRTDTCNTLSVIAHNPILKKSDPHFLYAADPAAEVFDGKVYVYCSHDVDGATSFSTMQDYLLLSSDDMQHWTNHGVVLKPRKYTWAYGQMNAPDVAYKEGWYYFYFPYDKTHIGVAKSQHPTGPWEEAVKDKITTIFDPCVVVDDDGQAYIYGNDHKVDIGDEGAHIMGAKLKDNMIELDGEWQRLSKEKVNEAVYVFKRKGIYYFQARVGKETKYWMADSPLPHYAELKGNLAPDAPAAPNHTSAIEFQGQWYFFYHRGDVNEGSFHRRSACFEKMYFNDDGTIKPIVYTLDN